MSVMRVSALHLYTNFEVCRLSGSKDMADFRSKLLGDLVTLTFDHLTSKWGHLVTFQAQDRQTDSQWPSMHLSPPYGADIINDNSGVGVECWKRWNAFRLVQIKTCCREYNRN